MNRHLYTVEYVQGALLAAVALGLMLCCGPTWPEPPVVPFERAKWQEEDQRWAQGHAIEREKALIGLTRQEVLDLLGPPSSDVRPDHLGYDIGGIPGEYLEIDLGTDGRVTRVWFGGY